MSESSTRRSGAFLSRVLVVVVVLVLLGGAIAVVDSVLRSQAEGAVRSDILARLPEGSTGDVRVSIGGFSFLGQLLLGRFERVELVGQGLTVQGVPIEARAVAHGVPADLSKPIERAGVELSVDEEALNTFLDLPEASDVKLGDGTVSYASPLLGLNSRYRVTAEAELAWPEVVFVPEWIGLDDRSAGLDIGMAGFRVPVCAAEYLPEGVTVDTLTITPGLLRAHASATDFVLSEDALRTRGSC